MPFPLRDVPPVTPKPVYPLHPGWFPRALPEVSRDLAAEPAACPDRPPLFTERHLQAIWYDDRLRPGALVAADGRSVVVQHPGEWNTGPGPDFLNATLLVGSDRTPLHGDVELHVRPSDWTAHGHTADPRYAGIVAHVTYYDAPAVPPPGLPATALQIALRPALEAIPDFAFDNIDLLAYPIGARAEPPPCQAAMAVLPSAVRGLILDRAGETRLRQRAELLALSMLDRGIDQILYEETMAALGYRWNKAPFRLLARRLPLATLRRHAQGSPLRAYAILMGLAGLLPDPTRTPRHAAWDEPTRTFIRRCWDAWWPLADLLAPLCLEPARWRLVGLRPANRPERRLMAAALLFAPPQGLPERLMELARASSSASLSPDELVAWFDFPDAPYWPYRLSFSTPPVFSPVALVGMARARALVVNLVLPALAAMGASPEAWAAIVAAIPPEEPNALIKATALRLLGPDHSPRLYRTGLRRQGLIHIHHAYCLSDRSRCATCPFPALLQSLVPAPSGSQEVLP